MATPAFHSDQHYTYGDYFHWNDGRRYELHEGVVIDMTPGPGARHQVVSSNIHYEIRKAFDAISNSGCSVFYAPIDVRLPEAGESDEETRTVVQPDLMIVCDPQKIDEKGIRGAPDFIIEILSPGTAKYDLEYKRNLYEKHGVHEYWIVHPTEKVITVFFLENGSYGTGKVFDEGEDLPLRILPGIQLPLAKVFS